MQDTPSGKPDNKKNTEDCNNDREEGKYNTLALDPGTHGNQGK